MSPNAIHPIELLVLSTVAALPFAVLAFTFAAAAHRAPTWSGRAARLGGVFVSWFCAVLVMRYALAGAFHDWPSASLGGALGVIVAAPGPALFACAHVTLASAVTHPRWRIVAATVPVVAFIAFTAATIPLRPLSAMAAGEATGLLVSLAASVLLAAIALGLVHIRSLVGRFAAALSALSGMQYARTGLRGWADVEASLFQLQPGLVSPVLAWTLLFFVGAVATVAVAEWLHLRVERRSADRIRDLATQDGLTGLLNRRSFDERIERPGGASSHLLMIDLDRFKAVNDAYGHAAGDALLRTLAVRFREAIGRRGVVARLGGDEFGALVDGDGGEVHDLANHLLEEACRPVSHDGSSFEVGASIGVAAQCDASCTETWRRNADLALYAAKARGRGCIVTFDDAMGREADERLSFERDVRAALPNGELVLHYQAQQDIRSGRTVGYEALLRWDHPGRGLVPPNVFIPLAEETGLIVPMGRWVLERAARDFAALDTDIRVSVNVSPIQIDTGDIIADVRDALEASGLEPYRLDLEVTESALMKDTDHTRRILEQLRELGVSLSLDDFGTGYASLATLTRFPFSKLKIDRAFVDRMGTDDRSRSLVRSILAMAKSLELRVTAEGVETHGQLLTLAQGACDEAQGFLLGRPASLDDVVRFMHEAASEEQDAATA